MSTASQTRSAAYAVMQRIFDEGFAAGDGSVAAELCSPDFVDHQFGTAGRGADAIAHLKDAMRDVHGAFPDIKFTIEDAVESGDTIWVRARGRGTASGPTSGRPAAGLWTSP
jgi:predicted ester cyclase